MEFTQGARKKVADLIRQAHFKSIISIEEEAVFLQMKNSVCQVSSQGKVTWFVDGLETITK